MNSAAWFITGLLAGLAAGIAIAAVVLLDHFRQLTRREIARWLRRWGSEIPEGDGFVNVGTFRQHIADVAARYEQGKI